MNDVMALTFKRRIFPKKWRVIRRVQHLPRFKVSRLTIRAEVSPDCIIEIGEEAHFVGENVLLEIQRSVSLPFYTRLAEVFGIEMIEYCDNDVNLDLFSIPSFVQVDWFRAYSTEIPDEILLLMKAKTICLRELRRPRMASTANRFFKQWFRKEREIKWFSLEQDHLEDENYIMPKELPADILWRYDNNPKNAFKVDFLKVPCVPYRLLGNDTIYSVDRGDKKLLVIAGRFNMRAMDYKELDDVIQIRSDNEKF